MDYTYGQPWVGHTYVINDIPRPCDIPERDPVLCENRSSIQPRANVLSNKRCLTIASH